MGTYKPGAFGPFKGTIGDVVASKWKGLNVVRNAPAKSSRAATQTQLEQRAKFKLAATFAGRIINFIQLGFRNVKGSVTPFNACVKTILDQAVTGAYPDYKLDYSKIRLTDSPKLDEGIGARAVALPEHKIQVSWEMDLHPNLYSRPTDEAYVLVHNPVLNKFASIWGGVQRADLSATIRVSGQQDSTRVECYLFFASADGTQVSDTSYLGSITVTA